MTSKETDAMWRTRSEQPEALRLAAALESLYSKTVASQQSAAELRRLHAANIDCVNHFNQLMDERNELMEALKDIVEFWDPIVPTDAVNQMHINARAAIAKATGEQA